MKAPEKFGAFFVDLNYGREYIVTMKSRRKKMRNHVAKELWSGKFRSQTVKSKKAYTRKQKHKNKGE